MAGRKGFEPLEPGVSWFASLAKRCDQPDSATFPLSDFLYNNIQADSFLK
jgi:hypothetical protein